MLQIKHIIKLIINTILLLLKDLKYYTQPEIIRKPYPPSFYYKHTPEEQERIEQEWLDKIYKLIDSMETTTDKESK